MFVRRPHIQHVILVLITAFIHSISYIKSKSVHLVVKYNSQICLARCLHDAMLAAYLVTKLATIYYHRCNALPSFLHRSAKKVSTVHYLSYKS